MSNNPSDNKIIIKFEIQIPAGGPSVVVQGPGIADPTLAPPRLESPSPTPVMTAVEKPNSPALVKVEGTGATGVVCSTASSDLSLGHPPSDVWLKVYDLMATIPQVPTDAVRAIPDGEDGSFSSWHHDAVPGAACGVQATGETLPYNRLVIYRQYSGYPSNAWTQEHRIFQGICSHETDCDERLSRKVVGTYPKAWSLDLSGFHGELAGLSAIKSLTHYSQSANGYVAWIAGGDGVTQPRAEFFGKSCGCEPFQLRLSCGGRRVVYLVPRDQFHPTGVNRLTWSSEFGAPCQGTFPNTLQLIPA